MKIIYVYRDSSKKAKSLVRHSDVPRIGDVVRITNFPDTEESYIVKKVLWSLNENKDLNPDVEVTIFLNRAYHEGWLGL